MSEFRLRFPLHPYTLTPLYPYTLTPLHPYNQQNMWHISSRPYNQSSTTYNQQNMWHISSRSSPSSSPSPSLPRLAVGTRGFAGRTSPSLPLTSPPFPHLLLLLLLPLLLLPHPPSPSPTFPHAAAAPALPVRRSAENVSATSATSRVTSRVTSSHIIHRESH